mgnify:CR=1 FL=1
MIEVEFLQSVSSEIGAFRSKQVISIPSNVAESWIASGICKATGKDVIKNTKKK